MARHLCSNPTFIGLLKPEKILSSVNTEFSLTVRQKKELRRLTTDMSDIAEQCIIAGLFCEDIATRELSISKSTDCSNERANWKIFTQTFVMFQQIKQTKH